MTIEHEIFAFIGILISVIGFFLIRSIKQNDDVIRDHENKLMRHDELIREIVGQLKTLQEVSNLQYDNLNKKLDHVVFKIDQYDENIKTFYSKYDLPLKK